MDPNLFAAAVGIVGVVLGALIGGIFVQRATRRQIEVMLQQSRGDVNERLYSQSLSIMKFFADNPELRPFFYDNKELKQAAGELEKARVLTAAEMVGGFIEVVALQFEEQTPEIQCRWQTYIVDAYNASPVLREHLATCEAWYAAELLRLLPARPATAVEKISGRPDASDSAAAKAAGRE